MKQPMKDLQKQNRRILQSSLWNYRPVIYKNLAFTFIADTEEINRGLTHYLISNIKKQRVTFPISNYTAIGRNRPQALG